LLWILIPFYWISHSISTYISNTIVHSLYSDMWLHLDHPYSSNVDPISYLFHLWIVFLSYVVHQSYFHYILHYSLLYSLIHWTILWNTLWFYILSDWSPIPLPIYYSLLSIYDSSIPPSYYKHSISSVSNILLVLWIIYSIIDSLSNHNYPSIHIIN